MQILALPGNVFHLCLFYHPWHVPGQEAVGFTLIVTEGFGDLRMAERTYSLLKSFEGKSASFTPKKKTAETAALFYFLSASVILSTIHAYYTARGRIRLQLQRKK